MNSGADVANAPRWERVQPTTTSSPGGQRRQKQFSLRWQQEKSLYDALNGKKKKPLRQAAQCASPAPSTRPSTTRNDYVPNPPHPKSTRAEARRFNSLMDAFRARKPDEMIFGIIGPFSAKIREKASLIVYAL